MSLLDLIELDSLHGHGMFAGVAREIAAVAKQRAAAAPKDGQKIASATMFAFDKLLRKHLVRTGQTAPVDAALTARARIPPPSSRAEQRGAVLDDEHRDRRHRHLEREREVRAVARAAARERARPQRAALERQVRALELGRDARRVARHVRDVVPEREVSRSLRF